MAITREIKIKKRKRKAVCAICDKECDKHKRWNKRGVVNRIRADGTKWRRNECDELMRGWLVRRPATLLAS